MNKFIQFLLSIFKAKQEIKEAKKQEKTSADVKEYYAPKDEVKEYPKTATETPGTIEANNMSIDLSKLNYVRMNIKYFKKEDVIACKEDFSITGDWKWIHINDRNHISHKDVDNKYKATGHIPFVLDENGYVHMGGHSGNDICSGFKEQKFSVLLTGKPVAYWVARCSFEMNPKSSKIHGGILLGRSNIIKVEVN